MTEEQKWNGINRRTCIDECAFADQARKSVPRMYVFAMIPIALAFAGWHISSMDKLRERNDVAIKSIEVHMKHEQLVHKNEMDKRMAESYKNYSVDVASFIRATGEIRVMMGEIKSDLNDIKVQNAEFKTKQDLVIKKIKLTE